MSPFAVPEATIVSDGVPGDCDQPPIAPFNFMPSAERKYCSFCSRPEDEVQTLVVGPAVTICNFCVDLCNSRIAESRSQ